MLPGKDEVEAARRFSHQDSRAKPEPAPERKDRKRGVASQQGIIARSAQDAQNYVCLAIILKK